MSKPIASPAQRCPHVVGSVGAVRLMKKIMGQGDHPVEPHFQKRRSDHQNKGWRVECSTTQPNERDQGSDDDTPLGRSGDLRN